MMKCPKCNKDISEFDMKCPHCGEVFEADDLMAQSTTEQVLDKLSKKRGKKIDTQRNYLKNTNKTEYAEKLNVIAYLNMIIYIIAAILVWVNFSTMKITKDYSVITKSYNTETVVNWYGILGGFVVLFSGYTLFVLLKTIVDIYNKD